MVTCVVGAQIWANSMVPSASYRLMQLYVNKVKLSMHAVSVEPISQLLAMSGAPPTITFHMYAMHAAIQDL